MSSALIPALPGTYVLLLRLEVEATVVVGRLGKFHFAAGGYAYVGSAHGPGGLRARVGRHLRREKAPHWHIDALTAVMAVQAVWWIASEERLECQWAERIRTLEGITIPANGFGASDCACATHLFALGPDHLGIMWMALGHPTRFIVSG